MNTKQEDGPGSGGGDVVKQPDKGVGCRLTPDTYQGIARGLIAGRTIVDMAEEFGVAPNTVQSLRQRHMEAIPTPKQRIAYKLGIVAEKACDKMMERLEADEVSERNLPIYAGITLDKQAQLMGDVPVSVVKHISVKQSTVEELLDRLPRAKVETNDQLLDSQSGAITTQTTGAE